MNFTQLRFVTATAKLESFTKAANFCYVTQPTLSNGIAKLEDELGDKLFERTTRTVHLTQFGKSLLPTMQAILNLEKSLLLEAKEHTDPQMQVFKIGISPLLNTKFIALLTNSYKELNTGLEILLIEDNLKSLDSKLNSGELDIIFVPVINKKSIKTSLALYEEELFFIENDPHEKSSIQIKDIRDRTFVMVPDSCGLSDITRSLISTSRSDVKEYEGKALSYQVLADWASNGLGSAILPKSKILPHIAKQQLCASSKPVTILFQAVWLPQNNKTLKNMLTHFEKNLDTINQGIA
ncbi:MAG: LysR family transcriptional regulator [SAR86 cluster bacterium]|uniref:LysR family transcriptional regulator n=1 Tax=SAR86 cluster bacterium TaxID=2030880 RepID=A0A2A4MR31_9GAMM|nr:MAG: LysR family transcriptional regulator [SAR86 cluster bacterium]